MLPSRYCLGGEKSCVGGDVPSTTAPMTWWTLPSFAESVLANLWKAGANAGLMGWNARWATAGLRKAEALSDLAMPLCGTQVSTIGGQLSLNGDWTNLLSILRDGLAAELSRVKGWVVVCKPCCRGVVESRMEQKARTLLSHTQSRPSRSILATTTSLHSYIRKHRARHRFIIAFIHLITAVPVALISHDHILRLSAQEREPGIVSKEITPTELNSQSLFGSGRRPAKSSSCRSRQME